MKRLSILFLLAVVIASLAHFSVGDPYGPGIQSDVKTFNVIASSTGDTDVIASVTGSRLRILSMAVIAQSTTAVDIYFENGDNALLFTAAKPLTIDAAGLDGQAGFILQPHEGGWLYTDTHTEAVIVNLSGNQDVSISGTYIEVVH